MVVLNGHVSSWVSGKAGVPQGPILGLPSNPKLFADDISLFSVINDSSATTKELNDDLLKINN